MTDASAAFARLDPARIALLLDVDGTLIDLAPSPFAVDVPESLKDSLARLLEKMPLALVSGRPIRDLDKLFAPLRLPAIGGHGAETRLQPGEAPERIPDLNMEFRRRLIAAVEGNAALEYEDKGYSVALHFRRAPQEEPRIAAHVQATLAAFPGEKAEMLPGKMMLEVKRPGISKGAAVRALMRRDPFARRTPVFIGDDVTDESAFAAMAELGGIAFSVGREFRGVDHVFAAPAEVRRAVKELGQEKSRRSDSSAEKISNIPRVPAQNRAGVEPIWQNGRLTLPAAAVSLDLDPRQFRAALVALRAELRDLAKEAKACPNIDVRPAKYLEQIADRIPSKLPNHAALYRLGHSESVLRQYASVIDAEWPDFLAARYHAITTQFDRTMRQAPSWRDFKRNAERDLLPEAYASDASRVAHEIADFLRAAEAKEFIDDSIPEALDQLAELAATNPTAGYDHTVLNVPGSNLAAYDVFESSNNVLKAIAEVALRAKVGAESVTHGIASAASRAAKNYVANYEKGVAKAASRLGTKHGEATVKWLNRLFVSGLAGGAGYPIAVRLIERFPEFFSWLGHIARFIL